MDKNVFDLFEKLTHNITTKRIDASADLLKILLNKQENISNEEEMSGDLQYCVERLIKGLASSRDSARLGFALLLTEVLKQMPIIKIEDVLELIKKNLVLNSNLEKRELIFGQLFAYTAIVRSGRLASHSHLSFVVMELLDLVQGKSYIANAVYEIMLDLFSQISTELFQDSVWPLLEKKLTFGWDISTADLLWPLLLIMRMFSKSISNTFFKKHWNSDDLFASENWEHLKKIIRQTTACLPNLHPFCSELIFILQSRKHFKNVWKSLVDENLFVDQTEKAYVGFEMVKKVLQQKPNKKIVKCVLSAEFCVIFTKSFLIAKHPMNPAAKAMAAFLCDYAKRSSDPDIQVTILNAFLETHGSSLPRRTIHYQDIFKKKEFSCLVQNLLPDAVKLYCENLQSIAVKRESSSVEDDVGSLVAKGSQAVLQIGNMVSHPVINSDTEWRLHIIKFLFLHSFFEVKTAIDLPHCDSTVSEISKTLREVFQNAFFKAFNSLHHRTQNHSVSLEQFLQYHLMLIEYAEQLMSAKESVLPLFSLEKVQESLAKVKSIIKKLKKQDKKDDKSKESIAFQDLFLEIALHLFHDPDYISELLEELQVCCKKALSARMNPVEDKDAEDEPSWICVAMDILLSLLSRSSVHMRNLVTTIFPRLCPFITGEALQQILTVITPAKSEEDPMLVDESEEAEFDSGSSSDESDANEPEEFHVDEEFKERLKQALGPAAEDSDAESIVLSDSEMFKLDDAISKTFQNRKLTGHTQMTAEEKTMLQFRMRCLDLIVVFLKSEPSIHLVVNSIQPILAACDYGHKGKHQKPLLEKVMTTLETIAKLKKFQNIVSVSKSQLKVILNDLVARCHKERDLRVAKIFYSLCVFIVLCMRRLESLNTPGKKTEKSSYMKIYVSALETFVKGSHMFPQFFVSLMESCPELAWHFIQPCVNYAFGDARIYKRTQCLGLIFEALKFSKHQNTIKSENWVEIGKLLIPAVIKALKEFLESTAIKPAYFTELLHVLHACSSVLKEKTNESPLDEHPELLPLLSNLNQSQMMKLFTKGNSIRKKIIRLLEGPVPQTNNESETLENTENGIGTEKKRKSTLMDNTSEKTNTKLKKLKSKHKKSKKESVVE